MSLKGGQVARDEIGKLGYVDGEKSVARPLESRFGLAPAPQGAGDVALQPQLMVLRFGKLCEESSGSEEYSASL